MAQSTIQQTDPGSSTFVNGHFPQRPWLVILLSAIAGFALTVIWSAEFVDSTIGDNVANTLLGHGLPHEPPNPFVIDVDAHEDPGTGGQPSADLDLLLVAAGQGAHGRVHRRRPHAQPVDVLEGEPVAGDRVECAGSPQSAQAREQEVLFSGIACAVERSAREHGYLVITGSSDEDPATERELVRSLVERRVDGLIVVPAGDDHRYPLPELQMGMRAVFADRPPGNIDLDAVLLDNVGGARLGTTHLLRHGHRRIAFVGDTPGIYTTPERHRGYSDALEAHGIAYDPALVRMGNHDTHAAETAVTDLLNAAAPPTAIFTSNNRIAVGALRALHRHDRPVALVGFDDVELAEVFATPLTVIAHNPAQMGAEAARLLWRRLDGDDGPAERVVLPTELIPRGSGEIALTG